MIDAYICDAIRTPIGKLNGSLSDVRADDLAALPLKALMTRNPHVDWERIDDVLMGCANQSGEDNRNVARMAVLLAGLNTPGITRVIEPVATRDHSEQMLKGFGAELSVEETPEGRIISLKGEAELRPQDIAVPGDPSSAAFFAVAALIVPGSDLVIEHVGLNPTRAGLYEVLRQMGGSIEELDRREVGGEPVADLRVRHSPLTGIEVDPAIVPSMVDEFPVLFVAAALAKGRTVTTGLDELRVKESDRIAVMAAALTGAGASVEETEDGLIIDGTAGEPLRGNGTSPAETHLDHRIAMSMAVAGLASRDGVEVDDTAPIATSFPVFEALLDEVTTA